MTRLPRLSGLLRIAGCALSLLVGVAATAAPVRLEVAVDAPLRSVDPFRLDAPATRDFGHMVFDTLYAPDADGDVRPQMVERHSVSADGMVWTFTLRDGLRFHDGQPVSADDVVASLQRWSARDPVGQTLFDAVAAIRALDAKRFEIRLSRPSGLLPDALGKPGANVPFIVPARLASQTGPITADEVVGSGPFRFESAGWTPGADARFRRFDGYVPRSEPASAMAGGKRVNVDEVRWHAYADPAAAVRALRAGRVDVVEHVRHDLIAGLAGKPDVKLRWLDADGEQLAFRFNVLQPPFDDAKVRRAVAIAFTQAPFLLAAVGGGERARPCVSLFVCRAPDRVSSALGPWLSGDLDAARALVRESGHEGARVVLLRATDVAVLRGLPRVAAGVLRQIGLDPVIESMDWAAIVKRRRERQAADEGGWNGLFDSVDSVDVADPISNPWLNASCGQALFGWPCDDLIQSLRYRYAHTPDATGRRKLLEQIEQREQDYPTHVPLGQWRAPTAMRVDISGALEAPVPVYWGYRKGRPAPADSGAGATAPAPARSGAPEGGTQRP